MKGRTEAALSRLQSAISGRQELDRPRLSCSLLHARTQTYTYTPLTVPPRTRALSIWCIRKDVKPQYEGGEERAEEVSWRTAVGRWGAGGAVEVIYGSERSGIFPRHIIYSFEFV